jgi:hypothetical protein
MSTQRVSVRREGDNILILKNGVLLIEMPYQAALGLSQALRVKAKEVEEEVCAQQIIADQALLLRAGAPFGLTGHPVILRESVKTALTDRNLRRYLPGGIASKAIVMAPRIIQHAPGKEKSNDQQ